MYGKLRLPWALCEWRQQIPSKFCHLCTNLNDFTAGISVLERDSLFSKASSTVMESSRPLIQWETARLLFCSGSEAAGA